MKQRILFVHQNFPAQFGQLAGALAAEGHEVVALGITLRPVAGVRGVRYAVPAQANSPAMRISREVEGQFTRGQACARAMQVLKDEGFMPDVIVAHPGWGEALFCKDVWPQARLLIFAEFFYSADGADVGFDAEFPSHGPESRLRIRLKNTVHLHALAAADGGYTPTRWQQQQIPSVYRPLFDVIFDGIDTDAVRPDARASIRLNRDGVTVRPGDEVLTFVNRNLEPYRGFHVFMRALPEILRRRPQARCVIIGGDEVSYGSKPRGHNNWREAMLAEVAHLLPPGRVHFLGRVPYADYLRVLQVSACHVYLTYPFVLSWSGVEAMAAGCVVVASRTAPVEEVIEHGRNGLLFDFFDVQALAGRVCNVLADPPRFATLAAAARAGVVERYDLGTRCLPALIKLVLDRCGT